MAMYSSIVIILLLLVSPVGLVLLLRAADLCSVFSPLAGFPPLSLNGGRFCSRQSSICNPWRDRGTSVASGLPDGGHGARGTQEWKGEGPHSEEHRLCPPTIDASQAVWLFFDGLDCRNKIKPGTERREGGREQEAGEGAID